MMRFTNCLLAVAVGLLVGLGNQGRAVSDGGAAREKHLRALVIAACASQPEDAAALLRLFPGSRLLEARILPFRGQPGASVHNLLLADGDEVRLRRRFPGGRLRRVTVEYHETMVGGQVRPAVSVAADGNCNISEVRRIAYGGDGVAARLTILGGDFKTVISSELLNPPIPTGQDHGGVAVAVIDTGVNYLLASVAARLARDSKGAALGYDYWDMDARPYDLDTGRSPFTPLRHGTTVTSIILREAPGARIIPYRYPRPDLSRMGDLIAAADGLGVVVVNIAMGSNKPDEWTAFGAAAKARPHMLFVVSAGNNGRDIDAEPVYPAALPLDNILVVTSADEFGRLADGSNWGVRAVDVMAPGERVPVIDHRGVAGKASGSSFAAPRVAAMAARLLEKHPAWRAPELKAAILARGRPSPRQGAAVVAAGWIPDPTDDFEPSH